LSAELQLDKSDWKPVTFGDVVKEVRQSTKDPAADGIERVVGLEHIEPECIHLRNWASIEDETTFTKVFRKGHVLFGRRRAYLKKAALADFDGICSGDITVMEAKDDLLPELLPFLVCNDKFFDYAVQHSAGGLSPRTKFKDLANYEFLIPPTGQQAKLAELLWAADQSIQCLRDCTTCTNVLQKAVRKNLLDYGYSSRSRELPPGWEKVRMRDLATVQSGATPARSHPEYYKEGTIPWVKTLDLRNGEVWETEEKITEAALADSSCKIRPVGTVFVAMYGGFNQIGRTGILMVPAATNQALAAIMLDDEERVLPEFLLYLLNAKVDYWKRVAISSRKDPNITKSDVEIFPIPLPPAETQRVIIEEISRTLKLEREVSVTRNSSSKLLKSLINQIF